MHRGRGAGLGLCLLAGVVGGGRAVAQADERPGAGPPSFEATVRPILRDTCSSCHDGPGGEGELDLRPFDDPSSLARNADGWRRIVRKLEAGEMPPPRAGRPAGLDSM